MVLLLLVVASGGCASSGRGEAVVNAEIDAILDVLGDTQGVRRYEFETANRLNCDQQAESDRFETKRAFRTDPVAEGAAEAVDRLVEHYEDAGAEVRQFSQGPSASTFLQAADRRRNVYVELTIGPQGDITPGSVYFTPCGIDFLPAPPPPSFVEEEPGS